MKKYVVEYDFFEEDVCRFAGNVFADNIDEALNVAEDTIPQLHNAILQVSNFNDSTESTWPQEIIDARNRRFK